MFSPPCRNDTQYRQNDQIWSFSMEPSCKSSAVTPIFFLVFRIRSTISHYCRSLKKFWTLEVFAANVLKPRCWHSWKNKTNINCHSCYSSSCLFVQAENRHFSCDTVKPKTTTNARNACRSTESLREDVTLCFRWQMFRGNSFSASVRSSSYP